MSVSNWISGGRVVLVAPFLVLAYGDSTAAAVGALVVFLLASISDFVDGYLARRNGTVTRLGEFLDPLADKLLVGAALIVLVDGRAFPLWAALVIAAREVVVQILRIRIVNAGGTLPASKVAKLKTSIQIVMVCWWLLPWEPNAGHWILLVAALATTLWSGTEYMLHAERSGALTG